VFAAKSYGGSGLAHESIDTALIFESIGQHELNGDVLMQGDVFGCDDYAHAADAENALDAVLVCEHIAWFDRGYHYGIVA